MTEERALNIARERYGEDVIFVYSTDGNKIMHRGTHEIYGIGTTWPEALASANKRDRFKKRLAQSKATASPEATERNQDEVENH